MKRVKWIVVLVVTLLMTLSCEKVIDLDGLNGDDKRTLVINGIATPDSLLTLYISKSYLSSEAPVIIPRDYYGEGLGCWIPNHQYGVSYPDEEDWNYDEMVKEYSYRYAKVSILVNGSEQYEMKYNSNTYMYHSNYRPAEGDHIQVSIADSDDGEGIKTETTVLKAQQLEVLNCEVRYEPVSVESTNNPMTITAASDSVAHIKLRLKDPGDEENYYRLKVRNAGYVEKYDYYYYQDVYKSEDEIFKDTRIARGWGGWSAYFSNVFDDHLFNGGEYTLDVKSWLPYTVVNAGDMKKRYLIIELQSMPKDFYLYYKSMMIYRITSDNDFAESSYIHSNVENGWGIFGSLNGEKHVIPL